MIVFLDLPGELVREMRRRTLDEGRRLSEVAEECIRRGFEPVPAGQRSEASDQWAIMSGELAKGDVMTLGESLVRAKVW